MAQALIITQVARSSAIEAGDIFPDGTQVTEGHLTVGGCDLVELAERHGTPLYVYDVGTIRARARAFRTALERSYPGRSTVCYAAKAHGAPWLLRVVASEGLGLDVVSGGELHAAAVAGFQPERITVHGNNKTRDELQDALGQGVGRVVLDNLDEIALLGSVAAGRRVRQPVLLRVAPGVEVATHAHLRTGGADTKFGLGIASGQAAEGVRAILAQGALELRGLHAHLGSQIREVEPYVKAVDRIFAFAAEMRGAAGLVLREVSPGGGFAVRYTPDDPPARAAETVGALGGVVAEAARSHGFDPLPDLAIEPGRSLVASAAVALYRVGSVKRIPGGRTFVAVDGGMADNVRPTAYGAAYTAVLADRAADPANTEVAIAGRYCESGDILIQRVRLPLPRVGDLVAIPVAGAYQLSLASNYNLVPRPAVVAIDGGEARLVRRRETYEDLLAQDVG